MKIKTRESLITIKIFNKAETLAQKSKNCVSTLHNSAEQTQNVGNKSGTEYAENQVQGAEETGTRNALYGLHRIGRWGVKETRRNIRRWKFHPKKPILAPNCQMLSATKTADKTAKTAKATQKTAKVPLKAPQKAAQTAKVVAKTTVAAVKATVAAVKGIVAAIISGGWIAVVVIVAICTIAMALGAMFSFFTHGNNDVSLNSVIFETENQLAENIEQYKYIYSCETVEIRGEPSPWKEVLAVYMVKYKVGGDDMDSIVLFDEKSVAKLKQVYNDFNNLSVEVEERIRTITEWEENESGKLVEVKREEFYNCMIVTHVTLTLDEMAERYEFNTKKKQTLYDLLSSNFDEFWELLFMEVYVK